jgi:hypothetical protein
MSLLRKPGRRGLCYANLGVGGKCLCYANLGGGGMSVFATSALRAWANLGKPRKPCFASQVCSAYGRVANLRCEAIRGLCFANLASQAWAPGPLGPWAPGQTWTGLRSKAEQVKSINQSVKFRSTSYKNIF